MSKIINVATAIIYDQVGNLLLAKRPKNKNMAGLWEFVGGKIEANETAELCLTRELKEEVNIDADQFEFLQNIDYQYDDFCLK